MDGWEFCFFQLCWESFKVNSPRCLEDTVLASRSQLWIPLSRSQFLIFQTQALFQTLSPQHNIFETLHSLTSMANMADLSSLHSAQLLASDPASLTLSNHKLVFLSFSFSHCKPTPTRQTSFYKIFLNTHLVMPVSVFKMF